MLLKFLFLWEVESAGFSDDGIPKPVRFPKQTQLLFSMQSQDFGGGGGGGERYGEGEHWLW